MKRIGLAMLWIGTSHGAVTTGAELEQAERNYQQLCQQCHGVNRIGGAGPALLPQSLGRIKPGEIRQVIENGRQIGRAHVEIQSLMRISYAVFCMKKKT